VVILVWPDGEWAYSWVAPLEIGPGSPKMIDLDKLGGYDLTDLEQKALMECLDEAENRRSR